MKKKASKKLPPKKMPKQAAPAEDDEEDMPGGEDGEPEEDEADDEESPSDEDSEGEDEDEQDPDSEEDDEDDTQSQHELKEDRLIAIMERTLQQLEQLQAQQHMMHGGGTHPAVMLGMGGAQPQAPMPVPGAPGGGLPPGMGQGGQQGNPAMAEMVKRAMG